MKKYIFALLLALLIATPTYAYVVKSGDYPIKLWGSNWRVELDKYGIDDPTKLPVGLEVDLGEPLLGATPTPTSSAPRVYIESSDWQLYNGAAAGDTTITLDDLEDIYGNDITMGSSTKMYGRINPDGVSESISFTGITTNSYGTKTLTGVKTALAQYPYTETSGLALSHSIGSLFRLSNTAGFYNDFANKENDEIVDGDWKFNAFPYFATSTDLPDADGEFATKYYVDTVGAGGFTSVNVSTTRGLEVYGTSPETVGINASSTLGMTFDSNGALYQSIGNALEYTGNAIAVNTSTIVSQIATSTPTANLIPIADGSGKLPIGWLNATSTTGTVYYSDGTQLYALPIGTAGQLLQTNSGATAPEWGADVNTLLGVGTNANKTFFTFQIAFDTSLWTASTYSTNYFVSSVYVGSGADAPESLMTTNGISAFAVNGSNPRALVFSDKRIIVEFGWNQRGAGTEQRGFGLASTAAAFQDYDDQTVDAVCFTIGTDEKLYAHTGNAGAGHTETEITGITLANINTYRIDFDPGVDAKFYINGTLKATITTNLPDSQTVKFGFGSTGSTGTSPDVMFMTAPTFAVEK